MTQFMLMFTIGPVQTFIAQARKTRDLWIGSYLLSTLMEAAMEDINGDMVFPTNRSIEGNIPDLPNKFVAIFDEKEQALMAAKHSEGKIEERWQEICEEIWSEIIKKQATKETTEIWQRQTNPDTLFEFFWVIVEGKNSEYSQWLKRTQKALDARKRLRNFMPQDEPGEKSTISGDREALRDQRNSRGDVKQFWRQIAVAGHRSPNDITQDGSERLDAIDTIKRFALHSGRLTKNMDGADFPSTSSVATAPFVYALLTRNIDLEAWLKVTKPLAIMSPKTIPFFQKQVAEEHKLLKLDGDCYFPETFTPSRLKQDYGFTDDIAEQRDTLIKNGKSALNALLRETKSRKISPPTPYYAIVQMDGDNMGILLSGVEDKEEHQKISTDLSQFARKEALSLVQEKYPGRLVYAGGDDVLAFVPITNVVDEQKDVTTNSLLKLTDDLQLHYCKYVKNAIHETHLSTTTISASTGVVIAHHYTPLSLVLQAARNAEKLAKEQYGRNALVITVIRHSGEQTRVGCKWQYENLQNRQPIQLFSEFYNFFKNDILSFKCVYTLLDEVSTLVGLPSEAQASEIKRTLKRQRNEGKRDMLSDKDIAALAEQLVVLANAMDADVDKKHAQDKEFKKSVELHAEGPRYGLVETFGWLLVMTFLARKGQD